MWAGIRYLPERSGRKRTALFCDEAFSLRAYLGSTFPSPRPDRLSWSQVDSTHLALTSRPAGAPLSANLIISKNIRKYIWLYARMSQEGHRLLTSADWCRKCNAEALSANDQPVVIARLLSSARKRASRSGRKARGLYFILC